MRCRHKTPFTPPCLKEPSCSKGFKKTPGMKFRIEKSRTIVDETKATPVAAAPVAQPK